MTANVGSVAGARGKAKSKSRGRKSFTVRLVISAVLLVAAATSPALVGSNHFKSISIDAWGPIGPDRTGWTGFLDRLPVRTSAALFLSYWLTLIVAATSFFLCLRSLIKWRVWAWSRNGIVASVLRVKRAKFWVNNKTHRGVELAVTCWAATADRWKSSWLRTKTNVVADRWMKSKAGIWVAINFYQRWDVIRSWVAFATNLRAIIDRVGNAWRAKEDRLATLGIVLAAGFVAIVVFQCHAFNRHGWDARTDLARASVLVTLTFTVAMFVEILAKPRVLPGGRWPVPQLAGVVAAVMGLGLIVMAFTTSNRAAMVWGADLAAIMAAVAASRNKLHKGPSSSGVESAVRSALLVATFAVWPVLFATRARVVVLLAILGIAVVVELCLKEFQRRRKTRLVQLAGQIAAGAILCEAAMVVVQVVFHLCRLFGSWRPAEVLPGWGSGIFRSLNPTTKMVEPVAWLGRSMNPTFALVTSTAATGLGLAAAGYWLWTVWPSRRKLSRASEDRSYFGPTTVQTVLLFWLSLLVAAVVYTQMMGGLTAGLYRSYRHADVVGPVLKSYPLVGKDPDAEFQAAKGRKGTFEQRVMYLVFARLGLLPPNRTFDRLYDEYTNKKDKFEQLLMFKAMEDDAGGLKKPLLVPKNGEPSPSGIELVVYLAMKAVVRPQSTGDNAGMTFDATTQLLASYAADVGSVRKEFPIRVDKGNKLSPPDDAGFRIPGSYFFSQPLATGTEMVTLLAREMYWTQNIEDSDADATPIVTLGSATASAGGSTDKSLIATTHNASNYPAPVLVWTDQPTGGLRPADMQLQTLATSLARVLDELPANEAVKRYTYWINVVRGPEQLIITALFLFAMTLLAWRFVVGCWQTRHAKRVVRWIRLHERLATTPERKKRLLRNLDRKLLAADGSLAHYLVDATAAGELSVARGVVERTERRGLWVILWITLSIPAVDFIGTVRGISEGLTFAEQIVRADTGPARAIAVTNVTSLLGLAFATTVTALSLLLLLTLFEKVVAAREASTISKLCRALAHLSPKRRDTEAAEPPRRREASTNLMVDKQVLMDFENTRKAHDRSAVSSLQLPNGNGEANRPDDHHPGSGGTP